MVGFYERLNNSMNLLIGNIYSYKEVDGATEIYKIIDMQINPKFGILKVTASLLDKQFQTKTTGIILSPEVLEELVFIENPLKSETK